VQPFLVKDIAVCRQVADAIGVELGLFDTVVRDGPMPLD
jgi:hypothetical protein